MVNKPTRKSAKRWAKKIGQITGIKPRFKLRYSPTESEDWGHTLPDLKKDRVIIGIQKDLSHPLSARKMFIPKRKHYDFVISHELGHGIGFNIFHNSSSGWVRHQFFSIMSEMEYCKRHLSKRFQAFMRGQISTAHPWEDGIVRSIFNSLPRSKERRKFLQQLAKLQMGNLDSLKESEHITKLLTMFLPAKKNKDKS